MKIFSLENHGFSISKTKIQFNSLKMNQLQAKKPYDNKWYRISSINPAPYAHSFLDSHYKFSFKTLATKLTSRKNKFRFWKRFSIWNLMLKWFKLLNKTNPWQVDFRNWNCINSSRKWLKRWKQKSMERELTFIM